MSTIIPEENHEEPPRNPRSSAGSNQEMPPPPPPQVPPRATPRTEIPSEPAHIYHAFDMKDQEVAPIGNPEFMFTLKTDGQLGVFYDRNVTMRTPVLLEVDAASIRDAAFRTLLSATERLLIIGKHLEASAVAGASQSLAIDLANGISVMLYQKLRTTNYHDFRTAERFYNKPKVPIPFEVPEPYALAISQLGQIKTSGLTQELYISPTVSPAQAANFCMPIGLKWSPVSYCRAVEYAKKIGMRFATVDLQVKMGSSWWLYRPVEENGVFSLHCPLPEENFTVNTAVLHSLFCINASGEFNNPICDLTPIGNADFGTMLRNPQDRVDLSTFFAIEGDVEVVWRVS